jgi:mannosyltransferase OCH1-like enzyme
MVELKYTVLGNHPLPLYRESTIPLNLFQTWHTDELPPKMKECVHALKEANPEFTHYLYTDVMCREFIKAHFEPLVLHVYDTLKPGAYKADLWRYCILYVHGGIYLDIKYRCVAPFKLLELTTKEHYVRDRDYGGNPGVYQAMMICYPKNHLLLRCIQGVIEYTLQMEYGASVLFVGPLLVGHMFNRSEMLTWDMQYTGLQIVRKDTPVLEMYSEYYHEVKTAAIRTYYMDSWCHRDAYNLPSLSSKKVHVLTCSMMYQNDRVFVRSPKWIDQGESRTLACQWSSYISREDGSFSGTHENRVSATLMTTDSFSGVDTTFWNQIVSQWTMHESEGIQYTYVTPEGVFRGTDMDTSAPLTQGVETTMYGFGSAIQLEKPCFVYRWYPMILLQDNLHVSKTTYQTPSFFKDLTSTAPCVLWKGQHWAVLTKCMQYELDGSIRKKYAHLFVVLNHELQVVKYSQFFKLENSAVSMISDFHIQDKIVLGFTISNGICMVAEYEESILDELFWNYVIPE